MVTSHAPKPARSHLRKMHAAERGWSNLLNMWHVCANTACRRARCCRGNPSYCYRHNYPQLPEAVKDWFALIGEFQAAGLPFEEAWAGLEKCGVLAEFVSWHNLAHGKRRRSPLPGKPRKESENTEESHGKPRHLNRRQLRERKTHDHDDTHRDSSAHRPTSERRCRRGSRRADCPRRQHEKRAAGRDRRAAAGLAGYRALFRCRDAGDRRAASRIRAAVSALDRRRDEAALDRVAARQRDRRFRSGRMGFSGRDAALEGILLRGPARRDAHHGAAGGRPVALCGLCVERGREQRAACAGERQARRLSARRRALAHHPGRERLQGVPPGRPQRGAGLRPNSACAGPRSGRAACRSVRR